MSLPLPAPRDCDRCGAADPGARRPPVGLIGLGLVGKALARRLLGAGCEVLGYDISPEATEAAAALGVRTAATAARVGAGCPVVLLSLPDSSVVGRVLWAEDGIGGLLGEGALVLDTTTGRPSDAEANAARLAETGVRFVDVTLSGSSEQIAAGEATALVGDAAERADYRGLVEAITPTVFYMGRPGAGCTAKLIVNLVMGLNRAALAEGLGLAARAGLDPARALEVLAGSAAHSKALEIKGRRMVEGDFAPASRISQHAKDVDLILELARQTGAWTPLEEAHAAVLSKALCAGWGDLDTAAIVRAYLER